MKNEIEAMITDITTTTAEAEDYTGEDGLLSVSYTHLDVYKRQVLPLLTRVSGLLMNTQRGFLFRPVRLHGQHLIQNMKIAVSTLPALATTTIASTWRF